MFNPNMLNGMEVEQQHSVEISNTSAPFECLDNNVGIGRASETIGKGKVSH
jgi:hypothetical protein